MKRILAVIILCLITIPALATAHVLEFNNGVGAVLHMDPQDEPVAGKPTIFYFAFSDKAGGFDARDCDCTLTITQNGQQVFENTLQAQTADTGSATYTFPTQNVYELQVRGKPASTAAFTSFTLNYVVRVDKGQGASANSAHYDQRAVYVTAAGIGLLIIFLLVRNMVVYNVKYYGKTSSKKS